MEERAGRGSSKTMLTRFSDARSDVAFIALAVSAGAILLYLGRSLTFWHDEWRSITFSGTASDYLRPVNEHWSTFPLLLYRATFGVFELRSYLPYLAELIVLHLGAVVAAYVLMRRRVGPLVATALAIPLLFLGAGSDNLFWAFQTGSVGSVTFGLWAIVFIERTGRWSPTITSVLLLASLMSSGLGLVFLVAGFGRAMFDPSLRIRVLATIPPSVAYVVWYLVVGHEAVRQVASPPDLVRFVVRGVAHSTGAVTGLGSSPEGRLIGLVLFTGLLFATGRAVIAGRPRALASGCVLAVATMYVLAGAVRARPDCFSCGATESRYVYPVGFLLVLSVADWLPVLRARTSSLPHGWAIGVGSLTLALALVVSTAANVGALRQTQALFKYRADLTRAHIAIARTHRGEPWIDPKVGIGVMPRVPVLLETVEAHGFPLTDSRVAPPGSRVYETAFLGLIGDRFRVERSAGRGRPVPITVVETDDLIAAEDGECISLREAGNEAGVTFSAPGGARIRVDAASTINGSAALGRYRAPSRTVELELEPHSPLDLVIPETGDGGRWQVRLEVGRATGRVRVCGVRVA